LDVPYAHMKGQMMIEEEFPTSFSANLARKDIGLVLEAAEAGGLRLPLTEAAAAHFDEAINAGYGEEDMAAIYEVAKPDQG
jgi:3-hydroxyisobutyrate dehydrogenase